jgi:hypothetical protein
MGNFPPTMYGKFTWRQRKKMHYLFFILIILTEKNGFDKNFNNKTFN